MLFWTKEEYKKFAFEMMDKPVSFYAFEMLYWCGIREGELLALTPSDFDFDKETVTINKSYQRLHGEDVITTPKTKKSNRTIKCRIFSVRKCRNISVCSTDSKERPYLYSNEKLSSSRDGQRCKSRRREAYPYS